MAERRRALVRAIRRGRSFRQVARRFRVGLATVHRWVRRAGRRRLDRVEWTNQPPIAHSTRRTPRTLEERVLSLRQQLKRSDLGQFGAVAIHRALHQEGLDPLPCVRTLGRILERSGVLDGRHRVRRPPPPRGWYLPQVAARHAELDSFDIVEGLVIKGGTAVEVLNGVSLHGGLALSCPRPTLTAKIAVEMIVAHWRECGLPHYAQFDNDTVFQGAHQFPDTMGRVARLCLSLEVMPVFVPPRETGFQAMIENYNGWWQAKVGARFEHHSLAELQERSARFVAASRRSRAQRIEAAPPRRPFPEGWSLDLKQPPQGRLIYLRRTTETGHVSLLGHTTLVDEAWPHRLVRVEVDLAAETMAFHALRRREPHWQPLLRSVPYRFPAREFQG